MKNSSPLDKPLFHRISRIVDAMGVEAYVVGGYVRDYYLRRPSTDVDVVVVGDGIAVAEALGREVHSHVAVFRRFGTAMVRAGGVEVEFVGARKESYSPDSRKPAVEAGTLEDDQRRRDFTINALAWSLNGSRFGELVDPFYGMDDLEDCIIRTPCDPDITFSDDPLRMMRAVRFATQLGFDIEEETFEAIERNRRRMEIVSAERIITELNKIILSPVPSIGFELLERTGLLELIFPELHRLRGVERVGQHAHKDNFQHTLKVLDNGSTFGQIFRQAFPNIPLVEVPANLETTNNGIVLICPQIVTLHHTALPQIKASGTDARTDEVWTKYFYGTAMVDVKEQGGIIVQPVTIS